MRLRPHIPFFVPENHRSAELLIARINDGTFSACVVRLALTRAKGWLESGSSTTQTMRFRSMHTAQVRITRTFQVVNTIRDSPTAVWACYPSIAEIKEELQWDERHNLMCDALVHVEDHPDDCEMQYSLSHFVLNWGSGKVDVGVVHTLVVKDIPVLIRAVDHWMGSENGLPQRGHRFVELNGSSWCQKRSNKKI